MIYLIKSIWENEYLPKYHYTIKIFYKIVYSWGDVSKEQNKYLCRD